MNQIDKEPNAPTTVDPPPTRFRFELLNAGRATSAPARSKPPAGRKRPSRWELGFALTAGVILRRRAHVGSLRADFL
jgi:hypothetical protein